MKFRVTMVEVSSRGAQTVVRDCDVRDYDEVVRIYGLNEPDILSYSITRLKE
jgi:hypothetical protein